MFFEVNKIFLVLTVDEFFIEHFRNIFTDIKMVTADARSDKKAEVFFPASYFVQENVRSF